MNWIWPESMEKNYYCSKVNLKRQFNNVLSNQINSCNFVCVVFFHWILKQFYHSKKHYVWHPTTFFFSFLLLLLITIIIIDGRFSRWMRWWWWWSSFIHGWLLYVEMAKKQKHLVWSKICITKLYPKVCYLSVCYLCVSVCECLTLMMTITPEKKDFF